MHAELPLYDMCMQNALQLTVYVHKWRLSCFNIYLEAAGLTATDPWCFLRALYDMVMIYYCILHVLYS